MSKLSYFLCGFVAVVGCSRPSGTYVVLAFSGDVSGAAPIASIALDLEMGNPKVSASAVFASPTGSSITLPTDATLQIQHGSGPISVIATAKSADGKTLGIGKKLGQVKAGQTQRMDVIFGNAGGEVGADGGLDTGIDLSPDLPVDRVSEAVPRDPDAGMDGKGVDRPGLSVDSGADMAGIGGASGTDGAAEMGGAGGTGGAGGPDASPDNPGSMGGAGAAGGGGSGGTVGAGGEAGTVVGVPKIVSEPSLLPFGDVLVGKIATLTTVIRNRGTGSTLAIDVKLSSPPSGPFFITNDTCSGKILAPGEDCNLTVSFAPGAQGPGGGVISIAAGATGTEITLSGAGIAPQPTMLTLQPLDGFFGVVDVGNKGNQVFSVANTGGSATSGLVVVLTAGLPAFQLNGDQCSNRVLAANTSCTFGITFAPTAAGLIKGTFTVKAPDLPTPLTGTVSGTGRMVATLTVNQIGNGKGTVNGPGLTCQEGGCTGVYSNTDPSNTGVSVTLNAVPDTYSNFGGWSGGGCVGTGPCTVVMNASTTMTATFKAIMVNVGLNVLSLASHTGTLRSADGSLNCSGACPPVSVPAAASITVTATPGAGFTFVGWTDGPCRGASPQCTFALNSDVMLSATFGPQAYMFVTSTTVIPGKLGGIAGADTECNTRARAAGLPGNYRAWLSTAGVDAKSRVGNGGWVRVDGRPFARNIASLAMLSNQVVYYPPRIDEKGNDVGIAHQLVATGGNSDGSSAGGQCVDYTSIGGSLNVGDVIAGSNYWSYSQQVPDGCVKDSRLYCFNIAVSADIRPSPQPGRRIFVTKDSWSPFGDISNADAFCRADATAAGLANASSFVALLSTSTASAVSRLTANGGPWKRMDDVVVFRIPNDMASNKLLATTGLLADGVTYGDYAFWSGANSAGALSAGDVSCQNWSSSSVSAHGLVGNANLSSMPEWFANPSTTSCDAIGMHLLCAEP